MHSTVPWGAASRGRQARQPGSPAHAAGGQQLVSHVVQALQLFAALQGCDPSRLGSGLKLWSCSRCGWTAHTGKQWTWQDAGAVNRGLD